MRNTDPNTPSGHSHQSLSRRQLLATAATLGVAPWLLSAHASPATGGASAVQRNAGSRRKLGPLEVFPIGLGSVGAGLGGHGRRGAAAALM